MAQSPKKPKPAAPPKMLIGRAQLALAFGVHPARISRWAADGMPVADRGGRGRESKFDLAAVVAWRVSTQVQSATQRTGDDGEPIDLSLERAKLARAQTERTLQDVSTKSKELLPVDEVRQVVGTAFHAVKAAVMALPKALAERCVEGSREGVAVVHAILETAAHDCLRSLARCPLTDQPATAGGDGA